MRKLMELLDQNLSYDDILDNLSEQTEDFTMLDGEVAFDDQYEAEVAVSILKNHYENVDNSGLDVINKDDSGFVIKFSSPIIDDLDFPQEEDVKESLNEEIVDLRQKYKRNPNIKLPEKPAQKTTNSAKFNIVLDLEQLNGWEVSWDFTIGNNDGELIELKKYLDKLEKAIDNYRHIKLSITDLQVGEIVEQTFDSPIAVNDIRQMISEFTGRDVGAKSAKKISSSIWQNSMNFWEYYDNNSKLALVTADDALAINPYIETDYKWMYSSVFDFVKQAYPTVAAYLKIIPAENTIHDNVMLDIIDAIKRDIIETIRQRNGVAGLHIAKPDNAAEYIYNVVAWLGLTKGKLFESLNEEIVDLRQKYKRNPNIKLPPKEAPAKKATIDDYYDPEDGFWGLKTYASEVSDLYSKLYEHYLGNQPLNLRDNEIKTIDKFIYQWFDKFMIAWRRLESIGKSEEEKLRTCIKTVSQKNDAYILLGVNDKEAAGKYLYVMMHLFDELLNQKDETS